LDEEPATPRPAATVIVLRHGGSHSQRGLEALMLRRGTEARFMPGVWVFPGGAVDPTDREAASSTQSGVEADELAHRICGARELGEEAAVPLTADALFPWSRWVTPTIVPIRFDTRFYVALAPPHCKPRPDLGEVDEARWIAPELALAEHGRDELELSFPTIKHLEELAGFPDADAVIAAGRSRHVEAITPQVKGDRDNFEVLLPGDPGFTDS
jgi:8-oxo-dGTP pyrophosphatase MutT (NUDIX family)